MILLNLSWPHVVIDPTPPLSASILQVFLLHEAHKEREYVLQPSPDSPQLFQIPFRLPAEQVESPMALHLSARVIVLQRRVQARLEGYKLHVRRSWKYHPIVLYQPLPVDDP